MISAMTSLPRPPCGLDQSTDPRLASQAYVDWLNDGSPWLFARPLQALADSLRAHGYTVYLAGNLSHLTKPVPEDHTPFSATGWPGPHPYPFCMAGDVMPPKPGQVSKLTGRPLPSLQRLAARLRSDRAAGRPAAGWVKYLNWEPDGDNAGDCWHDSWQPLYARTTSGDRGHIHVSGRTDLYLSTAADGYDLVARSEGTDTVTLYGWDLSHYDGPDARRAVTAEGFRFMTHKAGGDTLDAELGQWWDLMEPLRGSCLLGAYWVQYPGNPIGRADAFLNRLDTQCPRWRDGPFILQVDCEKWGGDPSTMPGKADIKAFCDRLRARMPKLNPIVYAPKWAYGDSLAGLGYPLWGSSYVTGSGSASSLYPGDTSSRWAAYSGQVPAILQFTSSATIAGQTTCDANAFRGTLADLTAIVAPGYAKTEADDMSTEDARVGFLGALWDAVHAIRRDDAYQSAEPQRQQQMRQMGSLLREIVGYDALGTLTASAAATGDALTRIDAVLVALPAVVSAEIGQIPGVDPAVLEAAVRRATTAILANLRLVYDAPVAGAETDD